MTGPFVAHAEIAGGPRFLPITGVIALFVAIICVASPGRARAYHDEETRSLDESAYLLRHGEWGLGLLELGVGLGPLQLSTRTGPWIIGAALGKAMPNVGLDGTIVDRRGVTLSAGGSLFYVNSNKLIEGDALIKLFVLPFTTSLSWRVNEKHTTSLLLKYMRVASDADADEEDLVVKGAALADNFQIHGSWELRLSRISALLFVARYLPYQGDPIFHSDAQLDDRTMAEVEGQVDTEDMQHAVAGSVSGLFSWKTFNLRVGLSYGNGLFFQGTGLVLPLQLPYPEFAFYWRI